MRSGDGRAVRPPPALPAAAPHPALLPLPRSELVLHSVNVAVLGALFTFGAAPRPGNLGVQVGAAEGWLRVWGTEVAALPLALPGRQWQTPHAHCAAVLPPAAACACAQIHTYPCTCRPQDYGGGLRTLALCPPTPNCISTAEEANDPAHYVPQW